MAFLKTVSVERLFISLGTSPQIFGLEWVGDSVEEIQKLLKDRLEKTRRHALGLHCPSTFQEEL